MIFHLNTFGIYFLITNVLISLIIGPVIILGFILLTFLILELSLKMLIINSSLISILLSIFNFIIYVVSKIFNLGIELILIISNIAKLPFSKIYIRTPKIYEILIYYIISFFINCLYSILSNKNPNPSELRVKYTLELLKYNYKKYKKKCIATVTLCIFVITIIFLFIPRNLQIHFVDVGQGDCSFIVTPNKKTILIDGGGNEFGSFDVGKSTLIPYILDRGYTKIDYMLISHFDSDHIRTGFYLLWKN